MTDNFKLYINTPDREFYQGEASMIELATTEGEIGVYANHIPLTAVLVPSVCTIHEGKEIKKAAIHGGIIEILPEKIVVLAEIAEWPDEIDVNRANEARIRAERRISSHDGSVNVARAELALARSLARIGAVD